MIIKTILRIGSMRTRMRKTIFSIFLIIFLNLRIMRKNVKRMRIITKEVTLDTLLLELKSILVMVCQLKFNKLLINEFVLTEVKQEVLDKLSIFK
jgi:hypothetical protein